MTQIRFDGCDLSPRGTRTPRFANLSRAAAALVALCLLVAGCGGDGRMSKPEYERTIDDAGRNLSKVFASADATTNLNQLAIRVTRGHRTLERVRTELADVKPPKDAERAHRQLVLALGTLSLDLERLALAAKSGYPESVRDARARVAAPGRQLIAAIQQLQQAGFDINNG